MRTISLKAENYKYFILTIPALLLYMLFLIVPVFSAFFYSFTDWNGITNGYRFNGINNYVRMLTDERFYNAIGITLYYTIVTTIIIAVLAFALALLVNRGIKLANFFRAMFFFPATLSLIVVGMLFSSIFLKPLPVLGNALGIEILSKSLLSSPKTAIYAIMIVNIWQGIAIPFVIFLAGLQSIPYDVLEAAAIDGANAKQRLRHIVLPFLVPTIEVVIVLLFRSGLTTFDYVMALTKGGPGWSTETLPILIYQQAFGGGMDFSYAITESVMLFVIMAIVTIIQVRYLDKKGVGEQ